MKQVQTFGANLRAERGSVNELRINAVEILNRSSEFLSNARFTKREHLRFSSFQHKFLQIPPTPKIQFCRKDKIMKDLEHTNHWIKVHGDLFLDLIRIYLGIGLFWKGVYFASHTTELQQLMEQSGTLWFASQAIGHTVIFAHLVGGFFLAIGLITRLAALVQVPVLAMAVFYVHLPKAFSAMEHRQNLEFTALILFLLVMISIYGAGRWSVDYVLARKENAKLFRTDDEQLPKPA